MNMHILIKTKIMKKILIIFFIIPFLFLSCNKENHKEYNKNMEIYKKVVEEINAYFDNSEEINISEYLTDDFVFYSYAAGNRNGQETPKSDYISNIESMKKMGMSINIGHSIYLPGVDKETYEFDGSVRVYYGATIKVDSNSVDFSGYQTIEFNNGKILSIEEWADYGGVQNFLTVN